MPWGWVHSPRILASRFLDTLKALVQYHLISRAAEEESNGSRFFMHHPFGEVNFPSCVWLGEGSIFLTPLPGACGPFQTEIFHFFKKYIYLFWPCWVLVVACGHLLRHADS